MQIDAFDCERISVCHRDRRSSRPTFRPSPAASGYSARTKPPGDGDQFAIVGTHHRQPVGGDDDRPVDRWAGGKRIVHAPRMPRNRTSQRQSAASPQRHCAASSGLKSCRALLRDRPRDRRHPRCRPRGRTRLSGTSSGEPAADIWVMAPGCSMRLSTAPSDSASVKTDVASATRMAASRPAATWNETIPPKSLICLAAAA